MGGEGCQNRFYPRAIWEKCQYVWWLVYVQYYVCMCMQARPRGVAGQFGVVGLFTLCRGWEYWAGWGSWFCTTNRQSPLLPLLISWWTCDSKENHNEKPLFEAITSLTGKHENEVKVPTISIFRSALSAGFLIRLQTKNKLKRLLIREHELLLLNMSVVGVCTPYKTRFWNQMQYFCQHQLWLKHNTRQQMKKLQFSVISWSTSLWKSRRMGALHFFFGL